jgi:glycosyltransferase involved in cell wall biosynthesis
MNSIAALIPAYNEESVIIDALESVAAQRRPPEQIIVVDDGSQDSTAAVVAAWSERKDLKVDLVRKPNGGLPSARNAGFRHAGTDYVALLDADDLWHRNHLADVERSLLSSPGAVMCFGAAQVTDMSGNILKHFPGDHIERGWSRTDLGSWISSRAEIYSTLLKGSYIAVSSTLISRAAAQSIGFMDETMLMIEDTDFWLRLSRTGNFIHVPTVVCSKRVHGRNMTNPRNALELNQWASRVLRKMLRNRTAMELSSDEVRSTVTALQQLTPHLLYTASQKGLAAYREACTDIIASGGFAANALNPRHMLRAAAISLGIMSQHAI